VLKSESKRVISKVNTKFNTLIQNIVEQTVAQHTTSTQQAGQLQVPANVLAPLTAQAK
jgi:hypothetical protein